MKNTASTGTNAVDWEARVDDHAVAVDPDVRGRLEAAGVALIGYEPLRELQRAGG